MKSQNENITTTSETQEPQYSLVCPVCRKVYKTKVPYEKHVAECQRRKETEQKLKQTNTQDEKEENDLLRNWNENTVSIIIDGFKNLSFDLKGEDQTKVSLPILFPAINSLMELNFMDMDKLDKIYNKIHKFSNTNLKEFKQLKDQLQRDKTNKKYLIQLLEFYNENGFAQFKRVLGQSHNFIDQLANVRMDYYTNIDLYELSQDPYRYKPYDYFSVVADLKQIIAVKSSSNICIVKQKENGCFRFIPKALKDVEQELKRYTVWTYKNEKGKTENTTLYDIYCKYRAALIYKDIRFFEQPPEPTTFYYFCGYSYWIDQIANEDLIEPFLLHIYNIICNSNQELYQYVIQWISYVLQRPGTKAGTCIIIIGEQGCGKNLFTDTLCNIIPEYSSSNINEIQDLTGKFNGLLENKMLIVLNELQNHGEAKYVNFDKLKAIITETSTRIELKFQEKREAETVCNFIMLSNNSNPVYIPEDDRRYVVLKASSEMKNNAEYFTPLFELVQKVEFRQNLLKYFLQFDINQFNPRKIPITEAKTQMIQNNLSEIDYFIAQNLDAFKEGITKSNAFESFLNYTSDKNLKPWTRNSFNAYLLKMCKETRKSFDLIGKSCRILKLIPEKVEFYEKLKESI